jgi:hypothetical protein
MTPRHPSEPGKRFHWAEAAIGAACGLGIMFTALFLGVMPLIRDFAGSRDFVVYWATGRQLLLHANPYDPVAMGQIEHAAGLAVKGTYYMRNPPWALPLTLPLGLFSARAASLPWSLLMLAILIVSVRMLWTMFGRPGNRLDLLGYIFPPALVCVMQGQTSLVVLLGLVLFLRLHRTRPFWAGAALWLCTLKPHLFLLFGAVLLVWIVFSRSYRILYGAAAAMAASWIATLCIDPSAWSQYRHWMHTSGIANEPIPCLSVVLRNLIDPAATWLALLPSLLGIVWAAVWFWRRRHTWDWLDQGGLLMLVSLLIAPYCWVWDQCLAIPALLYTAGRTQSKNLLGVLGLLYIVFEAQPLYVSGQTSLINLWLAPVWLVWVLWVRAVPGRDGLALPFTTEAPSAV